MVLEAVRGEYKRYRLLCESAMAQLEERQLFLAPTVDSNSIGVLVQHMAGNLASCFTDFLDSDGEKDWRNRDSEFEPVLGDRESLLACWNAGWGVLESTLAQLDDSQLGLTVTIRKQPLSVVEALERSLAHVAYHAGQIVLLARVHSGSDWKSLSIAKGASNLYNDNPDRERVPPA